MLIKAWCYYESRILGANYGLISTYALEILVLYIFNVFNASLTGPLVVLYRFLDYYSNFDWINYCISLDGPVNISLLPKIVVENPVKRGIDVLHGGKLLRSFIDMFMVPSKGSETSVRTFPRKHLNILDPLKENNNLGRSVNMGNFYRIRSAFRYGAQQLGKVLELPSENVGDEIKKFFVNTIQRHISRHVPDAVLTYSTLSTSSFSEASEPSDIEVSDDLDDNISGMNDVSTGESLEATNLSAFHSLSLGTANENMNVMSSHENIAKSFLLDIRRRDATGDTETLNPLADLTGDYDSHVRSLVHGQCCHGYALSAALVHTTHTNSLYTSGEPWQMAVYAPSSLIPELNPNVAVMGHTPYFTSHNTSPAVDTFHWLERHTSRGTGPYIPNANSYARASGSGTSSRSKSVRRRGPPQQMHQSRVRIGSDGMNWVSEANHQDPHPGGQSPPQGQVQSQAQGQDQGEEKGPGQGRIQSDVRRRVNSQRKLEFGSFGPLPENTFNAEASKPLVFGRRPGRVRIEPLHLKNEEEFPPLSA